MDLNKTWATAALLLATGVLAPCAWSHGGHEHDRHGAPAAGGGKSVKLTDTVLVDQDGRKRRLASDAVGDKLVVVTFVFTNCTDTCPMVSHTFSQVQEKLGPLMEQKVRLISLTIDPARDTPQRLKSYGAQFGAGAGWLWLTGERGAVTAALRDFGIRVASVENHPSQILVGDPRNGRWTRLYDIDNAQQVLASVAELLAARGPERHGANGDVRRENCARQLQAVAAAGEPGCVAQPGPEQFRDRTWASVIR
jgi:protein SCO1/2